MSNSELQLTADRQGIVHEDVLNIFLCLLADVRELSRVPLGFPDDITYDWVLKEGPKLDKELLKYLEDGGEFPSFPWWLKPLSDEFASSFDARLLGLLRQVLLFCYKIEHEPTYEQLQEAQKAFEDTDECIACWSEFNAQGHPQVLHSTARQIIGRIICGINWAKIIPSHGPGAVYPPCNPRDKSEFLTFYPTITEKYPFDSNFLAMPSFWHDELVRSDGRFNVSDDIVARLVAVPKDSRGPRLICVHPKEAIWIQQGCRKLLEDAITSRKSAARGRINFSDQSINGGLALSSSSTREYCTLDLKEASDRIGCDLVRSLFGDFAYSYLSCSRANKVRLLDNRVITLRKWAPMGNALCFPVQSLIFYSLVRAGIRCRYGVNCNDVYVFGDDLIFPSDYLDGVIRALVMSGLVPNRSKTFVAGFFRESCGVDAFKGFDVTPFRLKRVDYFTVSGSTSMCTLAKAMRMEQYYHTSDAIYRYVSRAFGPLHCSNNPNAQGIHRYENVGLDKLLLLEPSVRFNRLLHKWESRNLLVGGSVSRVSIGAWWHLQDSLLRLERSAQGRYSERGLEYAVPHRVRSQRGWTDVLMTSMPPSALSCRSCAVKHSFYDEERAGDLLRN
jgi:hypothetical protein